MENTRTRKQIFALQPVESKQALIHVANLALPSFQTIVLNTNLGCGHCRERVFEVVSKITGLKEYTVDVLNKQVIVRGDLQLYQAYRRGTNKKPSLKQVLVRWINRFIH